MIEAESPARGLTLRSFHRANALAIGAFLTLHIVTHLSGLWGIAAYGTVQELLRSVYRSPLIEPLLVAAVALQLGAGASLGLRAVKQARPHGFWQWSQLLSGAFVLFFLVQHFIALAMARLYLEVETGFYWPASVVSAPPFVYYFVPYYFLGVLAIFTHIGAAVRYRLAGGATATADRTGLAIILLGAVVAATIVAIFTGAFYDIRLSPDWIAYLRWYDPSFTPR